VEKRNRVWAKKTSSEKTVKKGNGDRISGNKIIPFSTNVGIEIQKKS